MKNKLPIVLKTNFINTYKIKSTSKKKLWLFSLLLLYVGISIFMMLKEFLGNIYKTLTTLQMTSYYLTILFSMASLFAFFFTIFSAKNALFDNKDNDLLFSLPLDKKTILLSRLTIILVYNFFIGLFVLIPGLYIFFSKEIVTLPTIIVILLLTLFFSVIPTLLASIFGYFIAFITSKSKHKNRIELLSYVIFIGLYMLVIYKGNSLLDLFIDNPELLTKILKYLFFPIYLINLSLMKDNFFYIVLYILLTIGVLLLFIFLLNRQYYSIIVKLKTEKQKSSFQMSTLSSNSPMVALTKKEIKRYFSSAIYVFNTSFGMILLLLASVASFIYQPSELLALIGEVPSLDASLLVFYLLLFSIAFSTTTNSSLSIERNNFWILKMLPLETNQIFQAKKNVNYLLIIPVVLVSLIFFVITRYITILEMLILFFLAIFLSMTIANFGLLCNLLFPKFDAPNDTVIVKQSASSMMGILLPMIFIVIYIVFLDTISLSKNLIFTISFFLFITLTFLTNIILNTWGRKKYKTLN